eukprot:2807747-Rhodomonas_salina.3
MDGLSLQHALRLLDQRRRPRGRHQNHADHNQGCGCRRGVRQASRQARPLWPLPRGGEKRAPVHCESTLSGSSRMGAFVKPRWKVLRYSLYQDSAYFETAQN